MNVSKWLHATCQWLLLGVLAAFTQLAIADAETAAAWGPPVGSKAPMLSANDWQGNQQDLESLSQANGLLFVFNRSVDW